MCVLQHIPVDLLNRVVGYISRCNVAIPQTAEGTIPMGTPNSQLPEQPQSTDASESTAEELPTAMEVSEPVG